MINEEPSLLQEHSLFSADTCKASQGSIAGRCLFTSTQSHNDSTHFEIRPLHTHTHTCVHAHTHTHAHTHNPQNVAILSYTLIPWPQVTDPRKVT